MYVRLCTYMRVYMSFDESRNVKKRHCSDPPEHTPASAKVGLPLHTNASCSSNASGYSSFSLSHNHIEIYVYMLYVCVHNQEL